jgi:hypothetical protein
MVRRKIPVYFRNFFIEGAYLYEKYGGHFWKVQNFPKVVYGNFSSG